MNPTLAAASAIAVALLLALSSPASAAALDPTQAAAETLHGIAVVDLQVISIEGILIVRGKVRTEADWRAAQSRLESLGYPRVANMLRVVPLATDQEIAREAERSLGLARGLRGAKLRVHANDGVVTIQGTVRNDWQRDAAAQIVSRINGVRAVRDQTTRV